MKRPEQKPHEDWVGIQGDSFQIVNMKKHIEENLPKPEKRHFILVDGKEFPQKYHKPAMAKRKGFSSTAPCNCSFNTSLRTNLNLSKKNNLFKTGENVEDDTFQFLHEYTDDPAPGSKDNYFLYYEFPAFPIENPLKQRPKATRSYVPRTVQERLPSRQEIRKAFAPEKKYTKADFAKTAPPTPSSTNSVSPTTTNPTTPRISRKKMKFRRSQSLLRNDKRSFLSVI
ncbi:hypothetical protein TRFO_10107 [Tritrichomonas foetus]|uniref:Uncharacterized protein n=1 Tax=Tritrichomonas foetus TaxID=1144522 RepID=A0A1J4JD36_9EUKA|nr:hypothetical protein TRFO_10107 [Tritrichomonas foetus]|eukprot:OHS96183.1 hypothetical protein TRFO_10107 [Tritrichomonas foetus]